MSDLSEPLEPRFHKDWRTSLQAVGLSGDNFCFFFKGIEEYLSVNAYDYSGEAEDAGGARMLRTHEVFQDIPPLDIFFLVEPPYITFLGLRRTVSKTTYPPPDWR